MTISLGLAAAVGAAACTGNSGTSSPTAPTASPTITGAWVRTFSDSSGSMMRAGLNSEMMNNAQWTIVQSGGMFSGTMKFPPPRNVSGERKRVAP